MSKVVGEVKERNTTDATAIPRRLLKTKSHSGKGAFDQIDNIQRVDTVGGLAPNTTCNLLNNGSEVKVDYSANYYFYKFGADNSIKP